METQNKSKLLLFILIIAAAIRLWKLGTIPSPLTPDEASLGYNAYSILKTGQDEYGQSLPIIFKSFGDYKPGLYVYLTVPFIALLGLNEFAVRLPSALAGVAAVWIIYLIVRELFKDKKLEIGGASPTACRPKLQRWRKAMTAARDWKLEILTAALLAVNPWHVHFSRGAWEVNVSLTLTLAGIYFFLRALKEVKLLYLSAISFALTLLTYQGAKLATIVVIFILVGIFWKEVKDWLASARPRLAGSIAIGIVISLPILISLFQGKTGRLEVFSVFSYPRPKEYLQTLLDQGGEKVGDLSYYLFHSESLNFLRGILGRWFNHFSGRFLFFEGDWQNPRHSAPNHGMLLLIDFLLLIVGFIELVRLRGKTSFFIFLWLILAPLPAILSRDQVHAVRSYNMVIPLIILSSIGAQRLIGSSFKVTGVGRKPPDGWFRFTPTAFILVLGLGFIYFMSFINFLDAYFVHLPIHNAEHWYYGYKQAVEVVTPIQGNYKKIIFQQSYDQPYIFFLFYQKYDPTKYQKQAKLIEGVVDVGLVEGLDNISFESFSWPHGTGEKGTLIVGDEVGIPPDFSKESYRLIKEIKYPDGFKTAFRILEVK